jgi:hypothetical protein
MFSVNAILQQPAILQTKYLPEACMQGQGKDMV